MSKGRVNINDALLFFVLLYAFSTVTQALYPVSMNRLWTVGIIFCTLFSIIKPLKKKDFKVLAVIALVSLTTCMLATNLSRNVNDTIYFATAVLWMLFMAKEECRQKLYDAYCKHEKFAFFIIVISYVTVLLSLVSSSGYAYQWGKIAYYVGFAGDQHAMASSLCTITSIFLLYSLKRKFSWIYMMVYAVSVYAVFETGARTFIIPILILTFFYIRHNIHSFSAKTVVYFVGTLGLAYIVLHSSMLEKFNFVSSGENMSSTLFEGFTSGRSVFWVIDIKAFLEGSPIQLFFGRGFDYVYELNYATVKQRIWAHNDFIHLLLGGGIISFVVYMQTIFRFLKSNIQYRNKLDKLLLVLYLFFPAMINGFFMYQHLLISLMILCICNIEFMKADNAIVRRKRNEQ